MIFIPPLRAIYQHPTDLRLCVLTDDTALDFTILRQESIESANWQITFAIIGESHAISVAHEGQLVLREVLACAAIPQDACCHNHHFAAGNDHQYAHPALSYQIEVQFDTTENWSNTAEHQIQVAFPEIWGRIPITRIGWQLAGHNLRWWTLHTYPHQSGITYASTASSLLLADTQNEGNGLCSQNYSSRR